MFNIQLGDFDKPEYTLKEIFHYLSIADKPCIIAIDEFQQIAKYPEKNIEALLRFLIYKRRQTVISSLPEASVKDDAGNVPTSSRPFYRSSDMLELKAIERPVYISFVVKQFAAGHKKSLLKMQERYTIYLTGIHSMSKRHLMKLFADTPSGKEMYAANY